MNMIQFQKNEWRWVVFYAVLLMLILNAPYLVGFLSETPARQFSGAIIAIDDTNSYLAKMNQGAHGDWLFTLPYSSEPQQGAPIYAFYLILGKLSGSAFTSRIIAYHLARTFFGMILIFSIYHFLADFLPQVYQRRMALIVATIGGGLGWLLMLSKEMTSGLPPLEFYSPEAFSFLMLFIFPHLLLARTLMLLALQTFLHHQYILSGFILVILGLLQPADVAIVWGIIGLFTVINLVMEGDFSRENLWKKLSPLLLIGLISAPVFAYIGYLFISDPILKQWAAQNVIKSPPPIHFLSAYGPYLALAIPGLKFLKKDQPKLWSFSLAWLVLVPIFAYLPIGLQRRLIEGFQVLLAALAILGLSTIHIRYQRLAKLFFICMVVPSSLILFMGAFQSASQPTQAAFESKDELAVFDWLNKNSGPGEIVLSSTLTGNLIPVHTSLTPFIGHPIETVYFTEKKKEVLAFYQPDTHADQRLLLIKTWNISYVFHGPEEEALGNLDVSSLPYLIKRFEKGAYSIYEVNHNE